jgi:signal transduction histidine kinase
VNLPFQPFLNTYGTSISLVIESTIITLGISKRYSHYRKKIQQLSIELLEQEKKISHVLMNIQEEEQRRIGRDLHDALGGLLATALMVLQKTKTKWPVPEKQKIEQLITQSISEMRTIAHNLVPSLLIENGLRYALFNFIDQLNLNQSTHFNLYYDISGTLSTEKQTIMYRICHELLYNISKHAQASEVSLQLVEEQDMMQIIAEDNGKGFDVFKPVEGIGLRNIRQRVAYLKGSLNIDSNENGTTVIIQIPYLP